MTDTPPDDRSPLDADDSALDRALSAGFQSEGTGDSVLRRLEALAGVAPRLRLQDDGAAVEGDVGKYAVAEEIGRGGIGIVFKGHDADLGRRVALKFLREQFRESPDSLRRFIEEAQVGGQLQHPGIVPVYDLGFHDGTPFFAMKLIEGRTFAALLAERSSTSDDLHRFLTIFEQVCHTVGYAHANGVVHRDLKPDNVMVGEFGEVQVVDWGLSKILASEVDAPSVQSVRQQDGSQSMSGSVMGTPAYMPPEQVLGQVEHVDARSDVFALGSILLEILTGKPCYTGSVEEQLAAARAWQIEDAHGRLHESNADDELIALAMRCTAKPREERPDNGARVASSIGSHLADVEQRAQLARIAAAEENVKAQAARRAQRLTTALVLVAVAGLVVSLLLWQQADAQGARAQKALDEFHLLADVVNLREAKQAEAALFPAHPELSARMRAWIDDRAAPLASRLSSLEQTLRALRVQSEEVDGRFVFSRKADQFLHDTLDELVTNLGDFAGPRGELAAVRERLAWAERVRDLSIASRESEWAEAAAAVRENAAYGDLELAPQIGLVPVGVDPESGFVEFVHLRSGTAGNAIPERAEDTKQLVVTEDTGIVFVLLPGGTFTMGAQPFSKTTLPNYDRFALKSHGPPHRVTLAPFLLAKHELTQGQWKRLSFGEVPSLFKPGSQPGGRRVVTWKNPVTNVTWAMCRELTRRQALLLPTEAQWEYACRAGTSAPWSTGAHPRRLKGHANIADVFAKKFQSAWQCDKYFDDGWVGPAPIGTYRANAFGMHDMHGNVWEWCRDEYDIYKRPVAAGDGLRLLEQESKYGRVYRGGSADMPALAARSSYRAFASESLRAPYLGVRVARALR